MSTPDEVIPPPDVPLIIYANPVGPVTLEIPASVVLADFEQSLQRMRETTVQGEGHGLNWHAQIRNGWGDTPPSMKDWPVDIPPERPCSIEVATHMVQAAGTVDSYEEVIQCLQRPIPLVIEVYPGPSWQVVPILHEGKGEEGNDELT